jgi:AcrR family transcriptional regulator
MAKRTTYHHGDLRRTLLDASLALVEESGLGALSLREVARKAGVSHNAPYHHFPDRGSLLTAIAEEGFALLAAECQRARAAAPDNARARLEACGMGYVTFALRAPAHFRVMFRPELSCADGKSVLFQAAVPAFDTVVGGVLECQAAGLAPPGDPMPLVLTCWSAVHGLASLWLDGPLAQDPRGFGKDPMKLATMVSSTIGTLMAAAGASAGSGTTRKNGTSVRATRKKARA